jgi:signal peptidase I
MGETISPATSAPRPALISVIVRDVILSILAGTLISMFLYRPIRVEGASMMPTLLDQERLFIDLFSYKLGLADIKRGDTVAFWYPEDPTKSNIGRVIGLPSEIVEAKDGLVTVNGSSREENYVRREHGDDRPYPATLVPANHYFILGDHRKSSLDSRNWGFVPRSYIYGKAVFHLLAPRSRRLHTLGTATALP